MVLPGLKSKPNQIIHWKQSTASFLIVLLLHFNLLAPNAAFSSKLVKHQSHKKALLESKKYERYYHGIKERSSPTQRKSGNSGGEDESNHEATPKEDESSNQICNEQSFSSDSSSNSEYLMSSDGINGYSDKHVDSSKKESGTPVSTIKFKENTLNVVPEQTASSQSILKALPILFKLSRPTNLPATLLFHGISIHLLLSSLPPSLSNPTMLSALKNPSLILTSICILLVSSSSMIINDYYDARSGVDVSSTSYHPLASGEIPLLTAKRFLSILYTFLLLAIAALPGVLTRLSVITGSLLTFWYTNHLKPRTWIKNVSCAVLIASSPLTTAFAMCHSYALPLATMKRCVILVVSLFFGIMSREITMDIGDYVSDKEANVSTIPVKYGRRFASLVALGLSCIMSGILLSAQYLVFLNKNKILPFLLSLVGVSIISWDAFCVWRTEGLNLRFLNQAVDHGQIAILFILASFI